MEILSGRFATPDQDRKPGVSRCAGSRWKNEQSYINPVPQSYGQFAIFGSRQPERSWGWKRHRGPERRAEAALDLPVTTDRAVVSPYENDLNGNAGFDSSYGARGH